LADHKADARSWVRALLGITADLDAADQADDATAQSASRYAWELAHPNDPDVPPLAHRLPRAISGRARWRAELLAAKDRAAQEREADVSATGELGTDDGAN
jgi:hypothetical protein